MTPQEINERIARLCGWFPVEDTESGLWHLSNMDGRRIGYLSALSENHAWQVLCPDYFNSLDACTQFEDLIDKEGSPTLDQYATALEDVTDARGSGWSWRYFCLIRAKPQQRCEAFLRVKGQWE